MPLSLRCPACHGAIDHLLARGNCPLCAVLISAHWLAIDGDVWVRQSVSAEARAELWRRSLGPHASVVMIYQLDWGNGNGE